MSDWSIWVCPSRYHRLSTAPVARLLATYLDAVNLKEEFGDTLWYLALGLRFLGIGFEETFAANIAKLQARFPDKFTEDAAMNRDPAAERAILEQGVTCVGETSKLADLFADDDGYDDDIEEATLPYREVLHHIAEDASTLAEARQWAFDAIPDDEIEGVCGTDDFHDQMVAARCARMKAERAARARRRDRA